MGHITAIIKGKCPHCEVGPVFQPSSLPGIKMSVMYHACSHCGHIFEKENGFFWGAMFISYALVVAEIIALLLISQQFFTEKLDARMIWIVVIAVCLLSSFNFRMSRLIWMHIFTSRSDVNA